MNKLLKKVGLLSIAFLAALGISACGKKKSTTDKNPSTRETGQYFKVTKGDKQISGVTVKVYEVKDVDGIPTKEEITDLSKDILKGTKLYFKITNNSTVDVKVSLSGATTKSTNVLKNEDGEIAGVELTGNIIINVEDATSIQYSTLTIDVDTSKDVEDEAYNSVHVYYPVGDTSDLASGADIEVGDTLKVYVWNAASDVNLKITNNGVVEVNKDYKKLTDEQMGPGGKGHNEFFTFEINGDVTVELTCIEEASVKYSVDVNNEFSNLTINLSYLKDDVSVPVAAGSTVDEGTVLFLQLLNDASEAYIVYVQNNSGIIVDSCMVEANGAGGILGIEVNSNLTFNATEYEEATVSISTISGVDIVAKDLSDPFEEKLLSDGDKVFIYAKVSLYAKNNTENSIIVALSMMDMTMGITIEAGEEHDFGTDFIPGDFSVKAEEYTEYEADIDFGSYLLRPYVMLIDDTSEAPVYINDGDTIAKYSLVMIMIMNQEESENLMLEIKNGSETVYSGVLADRFMLDNPISITGDLKIKVVLASDYE